MRIPGLRIYFVPPSKSNETTSSDVFEVIEIGCEEEYGDDKDEDARKNGLAGPLLGWIERAKKGHTSCHSEAGHPRGRPQDLLNSC